jgi:hypothetical protein
MMGSKLANGANTSIDRMYGIYPPVLRIEIVAREPPWCNNHMQSMEILVDILTSITCKNEP